MRAINRILLLAVLGLLIVAAGDAQQKPVHFKKLQEFLPKLDIPGYTKGKPGGQTSTAMGMSSSEATLKYEKDEPQNEDGSMVSVSVSIQDILGVPMGAMALSMIGGTEYESETENGYEKSIKVQGYPGKEMSETGEVKSAEVTIAVASRFLVTLRHEGASDAGVLKKLADNMKLADLAKTAQ